MRVVEARERVQVDLLDFHRVGFAVVFDEALIPAQNLLFGLGEFFLESFGGLFLLLDDLGNLFRLRFRGCGIAARHLGALFPRGFFGGLRTPAPFGGFFGVALLGGIRKDFVYYVVFQPVFPKAVGGLPVLGPFLLAAVGLKVAFSEKSKGFFILSLIHSRRASARSRNLS